jgi:competence protein ComEA
VAGLSRAQLAVYGAVAVALLLIGARAVRGETAPTSFSSGPDSGAGSGGFELSSSGGGGDVVVDVTGAVRRPGVYRLPGGSRVVDAVQRAGGAGPGGLLEAVNLAAHLADGQQIVIPERGPAGTAAASAAAGSGPISLGTATAGQLATIDGIGPVTAQDIIQFRDQHGGLASVEQLDQVSGIGPATMQSLREGLQP